MPEQTDVVRMDLAIDEDAFPRIPQPSHREQHGFLRHVQVDLAVGGDVGVHQGLAESHLVGQQTSNRVVTADPMRDAVTTLIRSAGDPFHYLHGKLE